MSRTSILRNSCYHQAITFELTVNDTPHPDFTDWNTFGWSGRIRILVFATCLVCQLTTCSINLDITCGLLFVSSELLKPNILQTPSNRSINNTLLLIPSLLTMVQWLSKRPTLSDSLMTDVIVLSIKDHLMFLRIVVSRHLSPFGRAEADRKTCVLIPSSLFFLMRVLPFTFMLLGGQQMQPIWISVLFSPPLLRVYSYRLYDAPLLHLETHTQTTCSITCTF